MPTLRNSYPRLDTKLPSTKLFHTICGGRRAGVQLPRPYINNGCTMCTAIIQWRSKFDNWGHISIRYAQLVSSKIDRSGGL